MGSVCYKKANPAEAEILSSRNSNDPNDSKMNASMSKENESVVSIDLEAQFMSMLSEIQLPEGELKEMIERLPPFNFGPIKDSKNLAIVKGSELTNDEIYYGFLQLLFVLFSDPIQNIREYKGVIFHKKGGYYIGEFLSGQIHGRGRKITPELTIYEGDFIHGREEGKGKCTFMNNSTYVGEWHEGRQNGHGIEDIPGSHHYEGNFKNGKKNGKGTCKLADGAIYEGEFVDDKYEGTGRYSRPNGKIYEGQWKNGSPKKFKIFTKTFIL